MLDLIFALKFVHVFAAATMFGVWLCLAIVMISGNPSVVAVTMQFIVDVEKWVMAPAIAAQPVSGFPLAWAIGLSPLNEYRSFAAQRILDRGVARAVCDRRCVLACGFSHRDSVRGLSRQSALEAVALPTAYRRMLHAWSALAVARSTGDHRNFCFDDLAAAGRLSSAGRQTRRQTICTLRDRKAS